MSESFADEVWKKLHAIDVSEHIEKLNNASYISWSVAWSILMSHYPESTYEFEDRNIEYASEIGEATVETKCTLTIAEGEKSVTRFVWLPVMQKMGTMASITNPSSRQISDTRFRCLVKVIAMNGLGLSLWSGEDIKPDLVVEEILKFAKIKSAVRMEIWRSAIVIKDAMADDKMGVALEAYRELNEEELKLLWVAETRGGYLTQAEKKALREANFADLHVERDEE